MLTDRRVLRAKLIRSEPPEIVILDEPEPCPYLDGRQARLPLRLPLRSLTREETDVRLEAGDRRYGRLFYRPCCPACQACEPLRVPVGGFRPSRTQKRVLARGDRELRMEVDDPVVTPERLALYEKHRSGRGLAKTMDTPIDEAGYGGFFVDRAVEAFELRFYRNEALVGFAICDRGARALSAVYCAFDPAFGQLSIGTYSILKQIELARSLDLDYVYLGLYVADNAHLRYKAGFYPHERRIDGTWRFFEKPDRTSTASCGPSGRHDSADA